MRVTPAGVSKATGPATKVTRAPASAAAAAMANPWRPEERLAMTRTGSIGSWVGPAVTRMWRPASPGYAAPAAGCSVRLVPVVAAGTCGMDKSVGSPSSVSGHTLLRV